MKHIVEVEEISIKVPWGHIAAKWWGPRIIRPIVMIHGWQDNAGTYDAIIPLLPRHVSYLALDLPGHGFSTKLPSGMIYSHIIYLYTLRLIHKKFNWEKISLCGHSMGSILSFMYASAFPKECDMIIGLDFLKPFEVSEHLVLDFYRNGLNQISESDEWNNNGLDPPSYSYELIVKKLMNGILTSYTEESLQYLLIRGMKASKLNPNKYYYTRDNRLKSLDEYMVPSEVNVYMAAQITAPYCFIKALPNGGETKWVHLDTILQKMKDSNREFEVHGVDGGHHVHLTEPEKVSNIFCRFINKHRPENTFSKL